MQIKRIDRIHYLDVDFGDSAGSVQGFTTRHEGVSRPPYNSLNLGFSTLDQKSSVEGNRSLLSRAFGVTYERLVTVKQVHGNDILVIDEPNDDFSHFLGIESDAIITNQPEILIGVCVADCVPIVMLDPVKRVIAAVHAGWQGTANSLVSKTVAAMKVEFGCHPADIKAAIGPCISKCCYEVDTPVKQAFKQNGLWEAVTEEIEGGKWRLDLVQANRFLLTDAGLTPEFIQSADMCVCCQREHFFSYRRDNGETGRQMGFIKLETRH